MTSPLTNRGVTDPAKRTLTPPRASIDWLQYSVRWPPDVPSWPDDPGATARILGAALPPADDIKLTGEILHPIRGYSDGMAATHARLFWHRRNRMQHIGVIMAGDDLRAMLTIPYPHEALIRWAVAKAHKIARLDFALDVYDPRANPLDVLDMWKHGHVGTPARKVSRVSSFENDATQGITEAATVYIGSRDGDRFIRVYDKAREQGVSGTWVRIEIVTRDERAWSLAKSCALYGIERAGQQAVRDFASIPKLSWWREALSAELAYIEPVGRALTNTDKWIYDVCLPAIQKRAKEQIAAGQWAVYDAVERALADILSSTKGTTK